MDEGGVCAMLSCCLQENNRAEGIDLEVEQRDLTCLIVRRLGGAMDYQPKLLFAEQAVHLRPITDINVVVSKSSCGLFEASEIPARVALPTEELSSQVVVNADDLVALRIEI